MKNNIKSIRKKIGLSVVELAEKLEMSQSNLTKIENAQIGLKPQTAEKIAKILNVSASALYQTSKEAQDFQKYISLINPEVWKMPRYSKFPLPEIITVPDSELQGYIAEDDTMSPVIPKNALVVVAPSKDMPFKDGLYLIEIDHQKYLRRLQKASGGNISVIADNKSYQSQLFLAEEIKIIARAFAVLSLSLL